MEGGPSHLDTFDYKPLLNKLAGQAAARELRHAAHGRGRRQVAAARVQTHLEAARPGRPVDLAIGSRTWRAMPMISP